MSLWHVYMPKIMANLVSNYRRNPQLMHWKKKNHDLLQQGSQIEKRKKKKKAHQ